MSKNHLETFKSWFTLKHCGPCQAELDKVAKAYGGGAGIDMTAFPDLKFVDPAVDPINISS